MPLTFSHVSSTSLGATAPVNPNVAPPGYYMLFVLNGSQVPSVAQMVRIGPSLVDVIPTPTLRRFTLRAAPNPVVDDAMLHYTLPFDADVRLTLVDVGGRVVRELEGGRRTAGPHRVSWDGRDRHGARVASGRYWAVLRAGGEEARGSLVVIR